MSLFFRIAVAAAGVVIGGCNCGTSGLVHQGSFIEVEPLALDFGSVPLGLTAELPVEVRNLGQKDLLISPAEFEGSDFLGPVDGIRLTAGEKRIIHVVFQPTASGSRTATMHLVSNAENDTDTAIDLAGIGVAGLSCNGCDVPPPNYCAGSTLITYDKVGTCQENKCLYKASQVVCGGSCSAATAMCQAQDSGTGGGGGGSDVDAGLSCINGRVRTCTNMCSGIQTCVSGMWGQCEACKGSGVGAVCTTAGCCIATGELTMQHPSLPPPYNYCATAAEEAEGLAPGVIITPTFSNWNVAHQPTRCCSQRAKVHSMQSSRCMYGIYEIRCF